jgi:glycosyltransferase involved in cell wall biosynthesis
MSDDVLVISPTPTHPQSAGNRSRIYNLLSSIASLDCNVHFLHVKKENGDELAMQKHWGDRFYSFNYRQPNNRFRQLNRRICRKLGLPGAYTYAIDEWYDPKLDDFIAKLVSNHSFKAVMIEYVFFSRALKCFDASVLKIIDTHDVFTNRHFHYLSKGERPTWFSTTQKEEAKGLNRADSIIAIQQNEADFFTSIADGRVVTIGHIIEPQRGQENAIVPGRILMLGSNNKINLQGANYFIQEVLPKITCKIPHAELILAGSICDGLSDHKKVVKLGVLDDLTTAYASAAVVVNPMQFGTGLKVKSIEAMSYSKPLVTTPTGAEGIEEGSGKAFMLAANDKEFADCIVQILSHPMLARKVSDSAYDFVTARNSQAVTMLKNIFEM